MVNQIVEGSLNANLITVDSIEKALMITSGIAATGIGLYFFNKVGRAINRNFHTTFDEDRGPGTVISFLTFVVAPIVTTIVMAMAE